MECNPERNEDRETVRDIGFSPLQDEHPALEVVQTSAEDGLEISLRFEPELKEVGAQVTACESSHN